MEDIVSTKLVEDSLFHEVTPIQMVEFVPTEVKDSLLEVTVIEENNEGEMGNSVNVSENIDDPAVGMIFDSVENLFEYYKMYGKKIGFEVMKRTSSKGYDRELKYVTFACSRVRKKISTSKNPLPLYPTTKTDCKAKLTASLCFDGKWRIRSTVLDHNHKLGTPGKLRFFKSNREIKPHVQRQLELNDRAGIRPNKSFNSFVVEAGGHENLTFLEKDCRNYLDRVRHLRLGEGDANAIQKYFLKMQADNSNFFYTMDLDEEGRLKNVFWADARSRALYKEFGDALTFDSTYLTNKYDMPFAAFVGVNHHGQSVLFGCGLISNEDTETYIWLFQSWLTCMSGCAPTAIITDQDKAMQKAIEIVFPNARHRWCLWHILKKLPEKLKSFKHYEDIKFRVLNVVYDSLTRDEFEDRWNELINVYGLHANEWLLRLYDERRRWVPAFLKDTFWAGMSTTQRSESMHAFFDGYVNSKTTLRQFVEQYENALRDKVEKENLADFSSFNSLVPCLTHYPIEKQFQDAYTTTKFKEFQNELKAKLYCVLSFDEDNGHYSKFIVREDVMVREVSHHRVPFIVQLSEVDCVVNCNCRLFETKGILCRHAIMVLIHKGIFVVPDKYILRRWRKDVTRCHTKMKIGYDNWSTKPEGHRFDKMCNSFYELAHLATGSDDMCNIVIEGITDLKTKLISNVGDNASSRYIPTLNNDTSKENCNILSPRAVRSKGRPPFKRKQSTVEKVVRKRKQNKLKKKSIDPEMTKDSEILESDRFANVDVPPTSDHDGNILATQESIMIEPNS